MAPDRQPDRLEELYDRHLDRELTPDEEAELIRMLADPERQKQWRALTFLEGKLQEELSASSLLGDAACARQEAGFQTAPAGGRVRGRSPLKSRMRRPTRRPTGMLYLLPALAAAAAVLFVLFSGDFAGTGRRTGPSLREPSVPRSGPARAAEADEKGRSKRWTGLALFDALEGKVEYSSAGTVMSGARRWSDAAEGTKLAVGDRVRTKLSRARIRFESGTLLYVNRHTAFSLAENAGPPGLRAAGGEVYVETAPADVGFYVETPHGRAASLGTRFDVRVDAEGTTVLVTDGRAEASTDAGRAEVGGGQEVCMVHRTSPPGPVQAARDPARRLAWAEGLGALGLARGPELPVAQSVPERVVDGLQALYTFREGSGVLVRDVSGVGEPLDLVLRDETAARWLEGGGLSVDRSTLLASDRPAAKIIRACTSTHEITIEARVEPVDTRQIGPARIATLSKDTRRCNFLLGMNWSEKAPPQESYTARLRTTETRESGSPVGLSGSPPLLSTPPATATLERTHVVFTRSASGTTCFYLNGKECARVQVGGDMSNWAEDFRLALANELTADRPWLGTFHLVAIYGRSLTAEEVATNCAACARSRQRPGRHVPVRSGRVRARE